MRRAAGALAAALLLVSARRAPAQVPRTVSPRLAALVGRTDTTVTTWIIARPGADLTRLAAAVTARGGRVRVVSRFVHAVSATLPASALREVAGLREVRRVQAMGTYVRRADGRSGGRADHAVPSARPPATVPVPDTLYGPGGWAVRLLNIPALHELGLRGAGVRIALLDTGFNTLHPYLAGATILAQRDFVYGDSVVRDEPGEAPGEMTHGTATWSLIAARAPGTLYGVAPDATFLLAKTEYTLTETRAEEDAWVAAVEWADSSGADIISSSLGYLTFDGGFSYAAGQLNGDVAVTTVAADSAAARGILVVVSAGNEGPAPRSLGTPADGDSVVAVGATDSTGRVVAFSSRGPTADGRIKPDVIAPGFAVTVAARDSGLTVMSGTSFSAPLVAGLAALVQGTRPGQSAVALLQGLLDAAGARFAPDNNQGHGLPDARALLLFPGGLRVTAPLDSGLASITPTFSWAPGAALVGVGPTLYRLRVATDSLLTRLVLDTTVLASSVGLPFAPPPRTRLWWRLTASNTDLAVAESTAVRGPLVVPDWVTLTSLASPAGHSIRDSLPVFRWSPRPVSAPPGPFRFDVDVYPSSRGPREAVATARGLADTTFQPGVPLERNLPYRWQVRARLAAGDSFAVTSPGTFIVLDESVPGATVLFQNFPNPFPNAALGVSTTCFWFDVVTEGPVRLEIFDLRGRLMRRLAPNAGGGVPAVLAAGRYGRPAGDATGTCDARFTWDGRDATGAFVRPGVYLYRLTAPGFRETRHVVFQGAP